MTRREFTTKVREDLIEEIRTIAKAEGREVDAAVEEAFARLCRTAAGEASRARDGAFSRQP